MFYKQTSCQNVSFLMTVENEIALPAWGTTRVRIRAFGKNGIV